MSDPRIDPVVDEIMSTVDADPRATEWATRFAERVLASIDKAATITTVEGLDALPIGTVVYAANNIGPAERFKEGWHGTGNPAAWSSAVLSNSGLPARVIHFGGSDV